MKRDGTQTLIIHGMVNGTHARQAMPEQTPLRNFAGVDAERFQPYRPRGICRHAYHENRGFWGLAVAGVGGAGMTIAFTAAVVAVFVWMRLRNTPPRA